MTLHVATDLDLPDDLVTQTVAILARRGAGKTYLAKVIAEEMIQHDLPVVVLDPIGVWWGLRSTADGKRAGYPVRILGGDHGDLPLTSAAGKLVANLVAEEPTAIVLDLSAIPSKTQQRQFATDFAEQLYVAKSSNRAPLHVIIDEADEFAPQRVPSGDQRQLGAFETLVRRGRARGLGVTMITQRPAVLNKNVLTQIECLVVMQITSPQDRKAIGEWVSGHAEPGEQAVVEESLASLKQGEAWFWSPAWLPQSLQRIQVRKATTFDSSATPKAGETAIEAKVLAPVDLDRLKDGMDRIVQEQEKNDPRLLRARIRELEREAKRQLAPKVETVTETVVERVEITPSWVAPMLADILGKVDDALERSERIRQELIERASQLAVESEGTGSHAILAERVPASARPTSTELRSFLPKAPPVPRTTDDPLERIGPNSGAMRMLVAAAQFPAGLTKSQLATQAKIKKTGGSYGTYLSRLRAAGLVTVQGDTIQITEQGLDVAGISDIRALVGVELIESWQERLGRDNGCRRMFDLLVAVHPQGLTKDELSERAEVERSGGSFSTYLSRLRSNGLIVVDGEDVRASDTLFM